MASGKSKSSQNPQGVRRKVGEKELAPRSLRRRYNKKYLSEFTEEQINKALEN